MKISISVNSNHSKEVKVIFTKHKEDHCLLIEIERNINNERRTTELATIDIKNFEIIKEILCGK